MIEFFSAQQSRAIDQSAILEAKIPGILLMKRAALFSYEILLSHYSQCRSLLVVCGTGNNGGDGFILAQLAHMAGIQTDLVLVGKKNSVQGDALVALNEALATGLTLQPFDSVECRQYDVIVDALFGIGLDRPIQGEHTKVIETINASQTPVLALDIPSGLHADTGAVLGIALQAQRTCTFITQKPGLYQFQGPDYAGKVHHSTLFLPDDILQTQTPVARNHSLKHWLQALPKRPISSHKGLSGTALLIGGDFHMMGAIQMAGLAALKVGCGLAQVITHSEHGVALTQALPELMCYDSDALSEKLEQARAIGIGPGLGMNNWGETLFNACIKADKPMVLDADALNWLAKNTEQADTLKCVGQHILTPHPGEAARLLDTTTSEIQNDRLAAIQALHNRYGGTIVLKGNGTLIYDGNQMEMCLAGNPGMAKGGMGDILTGTITGLLAQGMPSWEAACLGVNLHAQAGDILSQQHGQRGLLPTELASTISQLLTYADSNHV